MLLADADGFWTVRTFNDVLGIVGFVLTIGSIWLSWYLAERDLSRKINEAQRAAREAVERVAEMLFQADLTEAARWVRETREACRDRAWSRALDRCREAMARLARLQHEPKLQPDEQTKLGEAVDNLRLIGQYFERVMDPNDQPDDLSAVKKAQLDTLISLLHGIEGRLRATALEIRDGE